MHITSGKDKQFIITGKICSKYINQVSMFELLKYMLPISIGESIGLIFYRQ